MDFKVCHHGLQGMPSWTSKYAIMDFKVCHCRLQGIFVVINIIHCCHHHPLLLSLLSFVIIKTKLNIYCFPLKLSCRVSSRVAFTQRESFNNYSPPSGTVILKLFLIWYTSEGHQLNSPCKIRNKSEVWFMRY